MFGFCCFQTSVFLFDVILQHILDYMLALFLKRKLIFETQFEFNIFVFKKKFKKGRINLKAKRILSLVLSAIMLLTLFCVVPSMSASAAEETILYADTYGNLNNYSISSNENTYDGTHKLVGGMGLENNANMQTYESMVANGFSDIRYTDYVTFRVKATAAGTYTLKARIAPGGSIGSGYFVAMGVNDKKFYKQNVTTTGSQLVEFADVELEKGINLVRVFTRLGETQSLVQSGSWVNFDSLVIPAGLTGLEKGTASKLKAQDAHYRNYDASGDTNVGNAGGLYGSLVNMAFTYDTFKIGNIKVSPYLSYTVTVAEDGYYNMGISANTNTVGAEGYIVAFVDSVKTKIFYKHTESWSTKNISLYIPAGTHTISFTNVWGYTGDSANNGYTNWCDYGELTFYNGDVTLAATGVAPWTINDTTRVEAVNESDYFKYSDPYQANNEASGAQVAGNAQFDNSKVQHIDEAYVDKSNSAHFTFAVNAPADGTYTVKPGYYWAAADTITDKSVNLIVNGNNLYNVPFAKSGTSCWNSATVEVELTKGSNIIQLIPFTRESNVEGSWMNVDYLDLYDGLTEIPYSQYVKFEAEDALDSNISKFNNKRNTQSYTLGNGNEIEVTFVGGAQRDSIMSSGITTENFQLSTLGITPYVAITVNAPADGWYEIVGSVNSKEWADNAPLYSMLVKDGVPEAHAFNHSTNVNRGFMSDSKTEDRTAVDYTTYLTAGEHVLAFTSCIKNDPESTNIDQDYSYIDFDGFYLGQGLAIADVQQEFVVDNQYMSMEDATYINLYRKVFNTSKDAGFEANGFYSNFTVGRPPKNAAVSIKDLETHIDTYSTPFVAFAFDAPAAGEYVFNVRYCLGGNADDMDAFYAKHGEYPYATVMVNDGDTYKLHYSPTVDGKIQSGWWQTGSIAAQFKEGVNIVYLVSTTREIRREISGAWVDYGAISVGSDLQKADVDLYMVGDAGGDKYINANDVLRMKKYLTDSSILVNANYVDFDNNGTINASDLATMKKMVVNPASIPGLTFLKVKERATNSDGFTVLRSNPDNSVFLVEDAATVKTSRSSGKTNIDVNINNKWQTIDGFGGVFTDSTAQNMSMLSQEQLDQVMTDLFSTDESKGDALGLTVLRLPIGASDFADPVFTYNDIPYGEDDFNLTQFSIAHDTDPVNPKSALAGYNTTNGSSVMSMLKKAQQLSGNNIVFTACPWTAPIWMRTTNEWISVNKSTLRSNCYGVYADYQVKFLQSYRDNGISVSSLSPENEPGGEHTIVSMYMSAANINNFVKNYLNSRVNTYNSTFNESVQLIGFDFNIPFWDRDQVLTAEMLNGYYDIVAFHAYGQDGLPLDCSINNTLRNNYGVKIYMTEGAGNTGYDSYTDHYDSNGTLKVTYWNHPKNFFTNVNRTVNFMRNSTSVFCYFNIMLNEERGPASTEHGLYGQGVGTGLMGFNRRGNQYYKTEDYYALAHFSKVIRKGATILDSTRLTSATDYQGLNNLAAVNKDGSYAMVINNDTGFERPVSINTGLGYYIEYNVPARSSVSLSWTEGELAANAQ